LPGVARRRSRPAKRRSQPRPATRQILAGP
jgi:hypothetical protein